MGTPDFAVPTLELLIKSNHNVMAVFTQTDKPKGRGHKLTPPPVKVLAESHSIPVFQPVTFKDDDVVDSIKSMSPDVIVVVAYGKLLPQSVLDIPTHGCINVHGSLLPKYRGAGPIQWSVINGEEKTGITTMYMAKGIDTGDMILKDETAIGENETSSELHDRLSIMGANLLIKTLDMVQSNTAPRIPQDDTLSCYAPMLTKELAVIDFSKTTKEIHHLICGMSSWPCATTTLQDKKLKVYKSHIITESNIDYNNNAQVGQIVDLKNFVVKCIDGFIAFDIIQYDNSKAMNSADFLRGKRLNELEQLGI